MRGLYSHPRDLCYLRLPFRFPSFRLPLPLDADEPRKSSRLLASSSSSPPMRLRRFPRGAFGAAEPPELRELRLLRGVELPPSSLLSSSLLLRGESRSACALRRCVSLLDDVTEGESAAFLGILTFSPPSGPPPLFPATQIRLPPPPWLPRGEASPSLSLLSLPLLSPPLSLSLSLLSMILRWRRRGPCVLPVSSQHAVFPIAAPRASLELRSARRLERHCYLSFQPRRAAPVFTCGPFGAWGTRSAVLDMGCKALGRHSLRWY